MKESKPTQFRITTESGRLLVERVGLAAASGWALVCVCVRECEEGHRVGGETQSASFT